jgi:RNA polymerase sigma-70 factor (ECF subfamily)
MLMSDALIRRAVARDREATHELVGQLSPIIQARAARALLRRRATAGGRDARQEITDLTQHVFMLLFADEGRALLRWDPKGGASLANFIGVFAEHAIASILRSRRQSPWGEEPTDANDLAELSSADPGHEALVISKDILRIALDRVRARLTERGLEMFHWIVVEDHSLDEVCDLTGMKPDAVYAWRSRLAKLLREIAAEVSSDLKETSRTPAGQDADDRR